MERLADPILPGAMPHPRTTLIGREGERDRAQAFLLEEAVPLLSLTGPGGVGKTRLALAIAADVAAHFADGVVWIDLAPLTDTALAPMAVANALRITPQPGVSVAAAITRLLRAQQTLLLLDNCEHVLSEVARLLATLLEMCPAVQILATTRAPFRIRGEQQYPVDPLPLAADHPTLTALQQNDAVQLFVARARLVRPSFALDERTALPISDVCRQLDGLPLAIELAAAHSKTLSPQALLAQMTDRLRLLRHGPRDLPPRQQTMAATIAWSYGLLDPEGQCLFRRLSVFIGGFTLEAAAAVAVTLATAAEDVENGLAALVDQSLVRLVNEVGEPRYSMLETIREFGWQQLTESGEADTCRDRHAAYFADLVERLNARAVWFLLAGERVLARLDSEHPNVRAALHRLAEVGDVDHWLRLASGLSAYWEARGHYQEGIDWLDRALCAGQQATAAARTVGLCALANMFWGQGNFLRALEIGEAVLIAARGEADALTIALTAEACGLSALSLGRFDEATELIEEMGAAAALRPDAPWSPRLICFYWTDLGWIAINRGDQDLAEQHFAAAVELDRALIPADGVGFPWPELGLGHVLLHRGDAAGALRHFQTALHHAWRFGEVRAVVRGLDGIMEVLATTGAWEQAARLFGVSRAIRERAGTLPGPERLTKMFADAGITVHPWTSGNDMPLPEIIAEALTIDLRVERSPQARPRPISARDRFGLSPREQEVLGYLCQRWSDGEIAESLAISRRTVSSHVAHLFNKLGVSSRREAAAVATRYGLV